MAALIFGIAQRIHDAQPANRAELCGAYDAVDQQLLTQHLFSDNAVFRSVGTLGDVAGRYHESSAVQAEAKPLHKIAASKSTSGLEVANASTAIAGVCGHPLGLGLRSSLR
jgi:hypothetical protein